MLYKWRVIIAVNSVQFKQLERRSPKKIRASTGFEPVTSAIPVRCLPTELWSHTLGARSIYWVHIFPCSEMMWSSRHTPIQNSREYLPGPPCWCPLGKHQHISSSGENIMIINYQNSIMSFMLQTCDPSNPLGKMPRQTCVTRTKQKSTVRPMSYVKHPFVCLFSIF